MSGRLPAAKPRLIGLAALLVAALGLWLHDRGVTEPLTTWWSRVSPRSPTVVFVVMDTVRADHLSACGYARPTSPTLSGLVERGASLSCRAYAPGDWTVSSHASFFTGRPVHEHGAGLRNLNGPHALSGVEALDPARSLAGQMADRGYQTVSLSGNPLVTNSTGLALGFERSFGSGASGRLLDDSLRAELQRVLAEELDPERPLFLFLNLFEAHDDWPAIPEGLGWLPARRPFTLGRPEENPKSFMHRLYAGELDEAEREQGLAQLTDAYDYGVWRADRSLGVALERLEAHGWLSAGVRLVLTSDHGEALGEQGFVWHGGQAYEANQRVPLLVYSDDGEVPSLPEPISALEAFELALTGARPAEPRPITAIATAHPFAPQGYPVEDHTWSVLWRAGGKWVSRPSGRYRVNLQADPGEAGRFKLTEADAEAEATLDLLDAALERFDGGGEALSPEMIEALRAAGYMD
ncbi:MAG: sulfatase-like hydrolase/transferase [Alphaproteobacteria bacterium]|nr:sulfatase-like hydrolase/transferase [Alphaproteobacteria bacterium]MCB9797929.1 sulfatase-like hydrolase/transferase [Alphaproteobacteria bacterium]